MQNCVICAYYAQTTYKLSNHYTTYGQITNITQKNTQITQQIMQKKTQNYARNKHKICKITQKLRLNYTQIAHFIHKLRNKYAKLRKRIQKLRTFRKNYTSITQ